MESCYDTIVILDFGSQYTQLIARRIREIHVHSVILPASTSLQTIRDHSPKGLVFSGGPSSVTDASSPTWSEAVLQEGIPILGICYGMQLVAHHMGGRVGQSDRREFGRANLTVQDASDLFRGIETGTPFPVWMSHGDRIDSLPKGFIPIAKTENSPIAAMKHVEGAQRFYCLQFHPEVAHTTNGTRILQNFVQDICGCQSTWTMGSYLQNSIEEIRDKVGTKQVICGLSGGVDSAVAAAMTHRAIGKQLTCVFIDNGLLRKHEAVQLHKVFGSQDFNFVMVDASSKFLQALGRVADPEKKRKIIGRQFIKEFDAKAKEIGDVSFLVQGTLYPDVIESVSHKGPSATIKTHHNVGGLPARMKLKLIEPLRELFKDEVRELGRELGLPDDMVQRHPFPGPGLAIRILGAVSPERIAILREADAIFIDELRQHGLYHDVWQAFAVLLPVQTVGVMGDQRTYENVIAIRAVTSVDGMTADWARLPHEMLAIVSNRIINEVKGVNRVVYDVSSKPPSTIEWE
ncbi:MAG: glutamine-hydrolyzing GMP synthase [Nitrospirota bacterium]|nr:glutamine-hydrolyzing GMP synthase [Nitrospirota bacterium]